MSRQIQIEPEAPMPTVICPYCSQQADLTTGREVYPHILALRSKKFWICRDCDAFVGCHPGTNNPLGNPANKRLRSLRMVSHRLFDPLWKGGKMTRKEAYAWLSKKLNIPESDCHIGTFDEERCLKSHAVCREFRV